MAQLLMSGRYRIIKYLTSLSLSYFSQECKHYFQHFYVNVHTSAKYFNTNTSAVMLFKHLFDFSNDFHFEFVMFLCHHFVTWIFAKLLKLQLQQSKVNYKTSKQVSTTLTLNT